MNLNLLNEVIAALIGFVTTVLVPYLNKRFGTHLDPAAVDSTATDIANDIEKRYGIRIQTTPSPEPPAVPPVPMPMYPPTNPNEIGK